MANTRRMAKSQRTDRESLPDRKARFFRERRIRRPFYWLDRR